MLKNWKTSLLGILSLAVAAIAASQDSSMLAALKDFRVQLTILTGAIGLLAKDSGNEPPAK